MKKIHKNIAFLLLLFATFVASCQDSDDTLQEIVQPQEKYAQVAFNVTVPLNGLPSSRAIANDTKINDYVVWVFDNGNFVEAIKPDATYTVDGNTYPRISYDKTNGGKMFLMLSEKLTSVKLLMIANATVPQPNKGTILENAKTAIGTFTNSDLTYMPMYGESENGTITLIRAMAKVEVRANEVLDHFELKEMYVYRVNNTGTIVAQSTISNILTEKVQATVDEDNNLGYVYLPEIADVNRTTGIKTFVIIGGTYTDNSGRTSTKWYRLDFIKRTQIPGSGVTYDNLENIERNHRYIFEIDYLTPTAGHASLDEAVSAEADNKIIEGIQTMVIDDVDVMDITTDNYIYLGVTAGNLTAKQIGSGYYAVRIRVVTNNPDGWTIETLPEGVSVTMSSWIPTGDTVDETPQSIWVYIDGNVGVGTSKTLYIYSGNIRKTITVTTAE